MNDQVLREDWAMVVLITFLSNLLISPYLKFQELETGSIFKIGTSIFFETLHSILHQGCLLNQRGY